MGHRDLCADTDLSGRAHDNRDRYSARCVAASLVSDESLCRKNLCDGMCRQQLVAWSGRPIHLSRAFACGLVLYTALGLIPIVRAFVSLSAVLFGMGATVLTNRANIGR